MHARCGKEVRVLLGCSSSSCCGMTCGWHSNGFWHGGLVSVGFRVTGCPPDPGGNVDKCR